MSIKANQSKTRTREFSLTTHFFIKRIIFNRGGQNNSIIKIFGKKYGIGCLLKAKLCDRVSKLILDILKQ